MVNLSTVKQLALSFEETDEHAHFEKTAFRVKKKIFVSTDAKNNRICVKLSLIDQSVFSAFDKSVIYAVPNAWGKQGWTFVELKNVRKNMLMDVIRTAYCTVAPKKLADKYRTGDLHT